MSVSMNHRAGRAVLAAVAWWALSALPAAAETRKPNVLLILLDTLRADRLGAYGNARGLTPFLDGLARGRCSPTPMRRARGPARRWPRCSPRATPRSIATSRSRPSSAMRSSRSPMEGELRREAAVAQVKRPLDEATKEKLRALGYQP